MSRARTGIWVGILAGSGAVLRYPGGTPLDHATRGYSLSRNFLSDLGMTVAYNGERNWLGMALFVFSLLLLIGCVGACLLRVVQTVARAPGSRRLARIVSVVAALACMSFVGVAITPENAQMRLHIAFTLWAWRIVAGAAVLLWTAIVCSRQFGTGTAVGAGVFTATMLTYAALLTWGPAPTTLGGLEVQVVAQKTVTVVLIAFVLYLSIEAERASVRDHGFRL